LILAVEYTALNRTDVIEWWAVFESIAEPSYVQSKLGSAVCVQECSNLLSYICDCYQLIQQKPRTDMDTGCETYRAGIVVIVYTVVMFSVK
jgi:hypothetical protein